MKLLGIYPSKIVSYHRDELISLLQQAIAAGEYGGGKLIDQSVIDQLGTQAADFSTLPGLPAGVRATAQSFLYPLSLLSARYQTVSKERDEFLRRMDLYLTLLSKDANLIDQLVAAANMEAWVSRRGPLSGAIQFYQDFAATHGFVSADMPLTDPSTGVAYSKNVEDVVFLLNAVPGYEAEPLRQGIGVPGDIKAFKPIGLRWTYGTTTDQVEDLQGPDWAKLGLLEKAPLVRYGNPVAKALLPAGASVSQTFEISGSELSGNVPVFVRTFFTPRRVTVPITTGDAGDAIALSRYKLLGDEFVVQDPQRSYDQGVDYTVDQYGRFVPRTSCANKSLTVLYTEMFPAYQSSINETDWSKQVTFDSSLYSFTDGDRFPILDETNLPTGLWIRMLSLPATDYLIRIDTQAASDYGASATLEIEFDRPTFMNGMHLAPFAAYPSYLTSILAEGLTGDTGRVIYDSSILGEVAIDRAMTVRFDRQMVRRLFLTFRQENYQFKEHVISPVDQLRRETLVALQSSLPFSSRRMHITPTVRVDGAQYEFGLKDLYGEDRLVTMPQDYGVFVTGPFEVSGTPELLRLDAEYNGDVRFYLLDRPFNQLGVQVGSAFHDTQPHGVQVQPGVAFGFTPPGTEALLSKCQFYVKCVLRDQYAVVERFLLGVTV